MNAYIVNLARKVSITFIIGIIIVVSSCVTNEYKKIPLEDLDPKLKNTGSLIVKDILISINHEKGARYLLNKKYMTPLVHGRIMHYTEMYKEAYAMIPLTIGNISTFSLFQVVDKGIIKTMRYKLVTDTDNMKFIELKIDINQKYGLADYYLFLTSKDGLLKRENILPKVRK